MQKKCRKLRMGSLPYTPKTAKLGLTIEFWRSLIKKQEGKNVSSSYLRGTARQCGITNYRARAQVHCEYKNYIKIAHRPSFIDDLAYAIAADGDVERSTVIRQLKSQEESRHTHRLI